MTPSQLSDLKRKAETLNTIRNEKEATNPQSPDLKAGAR